MIVGTIAFETVQGIAHLAKDFLRHGVVNRVLVVQHSHYKSHNRYFPQEVRYDIKEMSSFLDGLDVLLLFETDLTYEWNCSKKAKRLGIKLALMPMYEYTPFPPPVTPDLVLCPSKLDMDYYADSYDSTYLPVPVERTWRLRERAYSFIHNAGHGQWDYAKGAVQLVEAMRLVRSPIKLRIRYLPDSLKMQALHSQYKNLHNVSWERVELPEEELYSSGDVFINAEKLNGLSLPLQEAWASGMCVVTTDRYPTNTWLPREPLIPVSRYEKCRIPGGSRIEFDKAIVNPKDIALTMDGIYGEDISRFSLAGKRYAETHSWEVLKPQYLKALQELL